MTDLDLILRKLNRLEKLMTKLDDSEGRLDADVRRVLSDQAAAIAKAVGDALAASQADEDTVSAAMDALDGAVNAFDPAPAAPPA